MTFEKLLAEAHATESDFPSTLWRFDDYTNAHLPIAFGSGPRGVSPIRNTIPSLHLRFYEEGFVVIRNLLPYETCEYIVQRFNSEKHERWPDMPGIKRVSRNDLKYVNVIHSQLKQFFSRIVGSILIPSYNFTARYEKGSILPAHTDKPTCVYNVSLVLGAVPSEFDPVAWPLFVNTHTGVHEIGLGVGDAVLYQGTRDMHWRNRMPDVFKEVTATFLHFTEAKGV